LHEVNIKIQLTERMDKSEITPCLASAATIALGERVWILRVMPLAEPHPAKVWTGIILFFAVGVVVGLAVAMYYIRLGTSLGAAIFVGSGAGGFGAWAVFALFFRAYHALRRSGGA
jgi:hypothetical protein